jgi:putative spermidine/putrescine transport system permease protein
LASYVTEIASEEVLGVREEPPAPVQRRRRRPRIARGLVLFAAAVYFLLPLYAGLKIGFENAEGRFAPLSTLQSISQQADLSPAFWLSMRLAGLATLFTLVLMVPTTIYVHLRLPRLRRTMDLVTILPIVFPPIVYVLGVLQTAPDQLKRSPYVLALVYVILAMPFVYRSLDAGLNAVDLKTLVEAAQSLGGRWVSTLWRVVLPNLSSAMISAVVLSFALVFGEYTIASFTPYMTLPVWIVSFAATSGNATVAVSMLALIGTWLLLSMIVVIDMVRTRRVARRRAGAS